MGTERLWSFELVESVFVVSFRPDTELSRKTLLAYLDALDKELPADIGSMLWDARCARFRGEFSQDHYEMFAEATRRVASRCDHLQRVAYLISSPSNKHQLSVFMQLFANMPFSQRGFFDSDQAWSWLKTGRLKP